MHAARRPRDASATLGLLLFVELWWIFMFIFFSCDMKLNGGLLLWGLAGSRSSRGSSHYSVDDRPEPSLGLPGKISIFCIQCAVSDFHWKIMIDCSVYLLMVVLCSSCRCIIAESWMNWINRPWVSGLFVIAKCVDIQVILLLERCSFYRSDDPLIKNNWGSGRQFDPPKVVSATQIQRTTLLPRLPHTCLLLLWHASDMFLPSRFLFFFHGQKCIP